MVFKRRKKLSWAQWIGAGFYPRGGWTRAVQYIRHRVTRLPDEPHRIARGVFAGTFISFTPLFGLHFLGAALVAWVLRGNILASLIATFVGNPITFPLIAAGSVELGNWILGHGGEMTPLQIAAAFGQASSELWGNIRAIFTDDPTHWDSLKRFFARVYLPYFVGGFGPGIIAGLVLYYVSLPVIAAYQKLRRKRLGDRLERNRAQRAEAARLRDATLRARDEAQAAAAATVEAQDAPPPPPAMPGGGDDGGGKP